MDNEIVISRHYVERAISLLKQIDQVTGFDNMDRLVAVVVMLERCMEPKPKQVYNGTEKEQDEGNDIEISTHPKTVAHRDQNGTEE